MARLIWFCMMLGAIYAAIQLHAQKNDVGAVIATLVAFLFFCLCLKRRPGQRL